MCKIIVKYFWINLYRMPDCVVQPWCTNLMQEHILCFLNVTIPVSIPFVCMMVCDLVWRSCHQNTLHVCGFSFGKCRTTGLQSASPLLRRYFWGFQTLRGQCVLEKKFISERWVTYSRNFWCEVIMLYTLNSVLCFSYISGKKRKKAK